MACLRRDLNSPAHIGKKCRILSSSYLSHYIPSGWRMFVLALIEDDVKIMPQDFRNQIKTIEEVIERKYCGKVCFSSSFP